MKIAIKCESLLLQKSLEMFLSNSLSSLKNAQVVLSDNKNYETDKEFLYISSDEDADIRKPFSSNTLLLALQKYKTNSSEIKNINTLSESLFETKDIKDFSTLEKELDILTQNYKNDMLNLVKAFYEK